MHNNLHWLNQIFPVLGFERDFPHPPPPPLFVFLFYYWAIKAKKWLKFLYVVSIIYCFENPNSATLYIFHVKL